jgi:serine/threonine protein kinase
MSSESVEPTEETGEERKQKPGRAVQMTAPGVLTAKEAPQGPVTLATGDVIGGRFEIERYLGASGGGVSYLCRDTASDSRAVIKVLAMPFPGKAKFDQMAEQVRIASRIQHRNLTRIIGMGRTPEGEIFVAMEYVKGATLSSILAKRREEGQKVSVRDTFTVLAHVCDALEAVHPFMPHGVLTPYNVYLDSRGVIRVGNLAFGRISADFLVQQGEGPYVDSIYVAPEVAEAPDLISSAADIYSLGMVAADMLSPAGLPNDRDEAKATAIMNLASYPSVLSKLITRAIGEDLAARPKSAADFRHAFEKAARELGADLTSPPGPDAIPVEPAVQDSASSDEDLFNLPGLSTGMSETSESSEERYLVQRDGLDYGPFTAEQVLEQLYADDINEFTQVLDRVTQDRKELQQFERFRKEVKEYIPKREERLRLEAERRAELERKVKKGGVFGISVAVVAGLVVLGIQIVFFLMQPDPKPMPLDQAFAELDYKFLPPPKEFVAVSVDKKVLESIFNPRASEEEIQKAIKKRKRSRKKSSGRAKPPTAGDNGVTEVDMSAGSGSTHILSDEEVNDVILSNFGGLRSCILKQLKSDPGFRGVTIKFFIRPTGTTGGVKIKESKYRSEPVADCLTSRFRSMRFPEHGGFNRGVEFPLLVQ